MGWNLRLSLSALGLISLMAQAESGDRIQFRNWILEVPPGWSRWQDGSDLVLSTLDGVATIRVKPGEDYQGSLSEWLMRRPGLSYADRAKVTLKAQTSVKNADGYPILLQPALVERASRNSEYVTFGATNPAGRAEMAVFSALNADAQQKYVGTFTKLWRDQSFTAKQPEKNTELKSAPDSRTPGDGEQITPEPLHQDPVASGGSRPSEGFISEVLKQKVRAGGKLKFGDYACAEMTRQSSALNPRSFRLSLLAAGAWRKIGPELDASGKPRETLGTLHYKQRDGRFDLVSKVWRLANDDQGLRWSRFFTNGKDAVIVAEDTNDVRKRTLCEWVSDADQSAKPLVQVQTSVDASTTIVTAPGQGLKQNAIEQILQTVSGATGATDYYYDRRNLLLLKDGTLYSGLRCAPADLKVTNSRRLEPHYWHRWRYDRDGGYVVEWNDKPGTWTKLEGKTIPPLRRGQRLAGQFSGTSVYVDGSVDGVIARTIRFELNGRFLMSGKGMYDRIRETVAAGPVYAGQSVDAGVTSATVPIEPGIIPDTAGHVTGSYLTDGYTLELRYDDGHVERMGAYFLNGKEQQLDLDGLALSGPMPIDAGVPQPRRLLPGRSRDADRHAKTTAAQRYDNLAVMRNEPLRHSAHE